MLGLAVNAPGITEATKINPTLFQACTSWLRVQEGAADFEVSSVQVNHNMMSKAHRDLANAGMSGLVIAGQSTGGKVLYWPLDTGGSVDEVRRTMSPIELHARKIQYFDWWCSHATKAFSGEHYSLVFFRVRGADKAPLALQKQ